MFFADAGADVVKLTSIHRESTESPGATAWDRSKRCAAADPTDRIWRRRMVRLVETADVVIADAPAPGWSLRPFGISIDIATARFPFTVFLHLPPHPIETPWAGAKDSHALLAAASGLAWAQGRRSGCAHPIDLVAPHTLYTQGILGAGAALAALLGRDRDRRGQVVTVTGLDGALLLSSALGDIVAPADEALKPEPETAAPEAGRPHSRSRLPDPFLGSYRCRDGRWVTLIAPTASNREAVVRELELDEVLTDPRLSGSLER
jgi:crotonobetainyl-CoA:carnitine CoA-transferase CaiB-like acyl-CoA transferase